MIAAIKKAGGNPKYTELQGVGHDSWTPAYTDPDGVRALDVRASRRNRSTLRLSRACRYGSIH